MSGQAVSCEGQSSVPLLMGATVLRYYHFGTKGLSGCDTLDFRIAPEGRAVPLRHEVQASHGALDTLGCSSVRWKIA